MSKRHLMLTAAFVLTVSASVSASVPWVEITPVVSNEDTPDEVEIPYGPVGGWMFVEPTPPPTTTVVPTVDTATRKRVAATLASAMHRATAVITTTPPPPRATANVSKPAPKKATQAPAPVKVVAGNAAQVAVNFALAQEGDPYKWGATGPDAWDCSGLVNRAYRAAGIQLTRTTRTLIHEGRAVERAALIKGDLVFTRAGHVGLYVGNNRIVHAPQAGENVKVSVIWAFYTARRVA